MKNIETALSNVIGSFALEGITLSDETIEKCKKILSGEIDGEEEAAQLIAAYKEQTVDTNPKKTGK